MNTYKDNPAKGLSELQKKILMWIARPSARFSKPEDFPERAQMWVGRPTFTSEKYRIDRICKQGFSRSNSAAVSRALRKLVERGLVIRYEYLDSHWHRDGKTDWVALTDAGVEVVKVLDASDK